MDLQISLRSVLLALVLKECLCQDTRVKYFLKDTEEQRCNENFHSFETRSKIECAVLCEGSATCKSFRYSRRGRTCYHSDLILCNTDVYHESGEKLSDVTGRAETTAATTTTAASTTTATTTSTNEATTTADIPCDCPLQESEYNNGDRLKYYNWMTATYSTAITYCVNEEGHLYTASSVGALDHLRNCCVWQNDIWLDGHDGLDYTDNELEWSEWENGTDPEAPYCPFIAKTGGLMIAGDCNLFKCFVCSFSDD